MRAIVAGPPAAQPMRQLYHPTAGVVGQSLLSVGALWCNQGHRFAAPGVASKEIVVTAPFAIALYDRVYSSDAWSQIWCERRYYYLGFGVPLLLLVFLIWATRTAIALVSNGWVFGNMRLTSAWQLPIICG